MSVDPSSYGPLVERYLSRSTPSPLGPGQPHREVIRELERLSPDALFDGLELVDEAMATCCLSGLLLLHDGLEESHRLSQAIDNAEGSTWHGIMHRREPDAPNAKYWFRRAGPHPVGAALAAAAQPLLEPVGAAEVVAGPWDPAAFIDLCESARGTANDLERACIAVQQEECLLLFDHCYHRAIGQTPS